MFGYEFLAPNVLYEPSPVVNAGKPDGYPAGSVTQDQQSAVYIVHGPGRHLRDVRRLHASGLPDRLEAGTGYYRVPVPWQQVHPRWRQDRGSGAHPLPWLRAWINEDGDLLIDRSEPLGQKQFVRT